MGFLSPGGVAKKNWNLIFGASGNPDLLLLLLGIYGKAKDSSIYNRTLTCQAPIDVTGAFPLFGNPTYDFSTAGGSSVLIVPNALFIPQSIATGYWQINWWFSPSFLSLAEPRYASFSTIEFSANNAGSLSATCYNLGGTSYTLSTPAGYASVGNWYFCTFARESLNVLQDVLRFYAGPLGGSCDLQAQSSAFLKTRQLANVAGFSDLINYNGAGSKGYMTNLRILRGSNPGGVSFPCPTAFYTP